MADRIENERRKTPDRREGRDRRDGRDRRRTQDRNYARGLPDEFAQAAGSAEDRIAGLVNRYWAHSEASARQTLARQLLPVLEELSIRGTPVTEEHREKCEEIVVEWAATFETISTD